jgi:hypothetical protein
MVLRLSPVPFPGGHLLIAPLPTRANLVPDRVSSRSWRFFPLGDIVLLTSIPGYPNTNDWRKSVRNFVHSASLALERLDSLEYGTSTKASSRSMIPQQRPLTNPFLLVMQASGRSSEEVSPSNNVRWTDSYCTICTDIVLQGPLCPRDDRSESPSSTHTVVELLGVTSMIPLPATIPLGENQIATLT